MSVTLPTVHWLVLCAWYIAMHREKCLDEDSLIISVTKWRGDSAIRDPLYRKRYILCK